MERISAADPGCTRIRQIPGIGPIVATAIVAAIGNGAAFRKGRDFAAWLGFVPRQYSTGGKAKLFGISKRGNVYLRKILIHGARAAVLRIKRDRAPIGAWLDALDARAPKNVVVVAMANKLARIAWAVLSSSSPEKVDGLSYLSFHIGRAEEAESGMKTVGVVEAFDIGEYISFCLLSGVVNAVMNALSFQCVEEAFHWCIIPTIALSTHRGQDVCGSQVLAIGFSRVLNSPI